MDFPVQMLPPAAQDAIKAQAALGNYRIESVGTAALAIMSHAVQGLYNVDSLQRQGVSYPLSQLFLILSPSGDAKSSIFKGLMTGIERWQDRQARVFDQQKIEYEVDKRQYEKARSSANKDQENSREAILEIERRKPLLPRSPWNTPSKITTNGIFQTLETGWPTCGIFTGEGGSLLAGHSLRKENSPAEFASALTTIWDGDTVDRTTGEVTMRLRGRRLSGLIMVQPEVARNFLQDATLRQHGIHARFCIVTPAAWEPLDLDFTDPVEKARRSQLMERLNAFHDRIDNLLSEPLVTSDHDDRELLPTTLGWSTDAARHMVEFQRRANSMRREEETFFKRVFEHACRMAGVLAAFEGEAEISLDMAKAATALIDFYSHQWRSLDLPIADERDTRHAAYIDKVLKYIRKAGRVTAREIARHAMQRIDIRIRDAVLDAMIRDQFIIAKEEKSGTTTTVYYTIAS